MNKWKTAFLGTFIFTILVITIAGYIVFATFITSGHCKDTQIIIKEDLNVISDALVNGARSISEFDTELNKLEAGHWTDQENGLIRLQIVHIVFDDKGNFQRIKTY
ncbi:hypothetical protein [Flammeovirga sp. SJP92]|uniref:hypothetical protein n=1 Tax=Flammeovirga sp. SJP92 TaxID=1775430 RepID=UPI0007871538|nr:hypothetical protein [Flammeovirga sp. SJP92]KXX66941.1 hypothetical protein AVL50_29755 [Flammeovirga sp. SJP92]